MDTRGFTLVELLVGVAIISIMMMLALPAYNQFMGNARIRSVADSLANGIRQTQVEAIKRNRFVEFTFDAGGWTITDPDPDVGGPVAQELFSEANGAVSLQTDPAGSTKLTYSGLGVYQTPNPDLGSGTTVPIGSIRVTSAVVSNPLNLRVAADPALGIGVRVCDRDSANRLAATDAQKCPAGIP